MLDFKILWIVFVSGVALNLPSLLWAAQEGGVDTQLERLELPSNQPPAGVPPEKLYAVQNRFAPLHWRSELTVGGDVNFNADGFLNSRELEASYRIHINDKWSIAVSGSYVFNSFTAAANNLLDETGLYPDVTFTRARGDLLVSYQPFYGKIRFGMDSVVYFDQYLSLGGGVVDFSLATRPAAVADVGFVFWLSKWGSVRVGLKDYFCNEPRRNDSHYVNSVLGHLDFGLLFGGA